MGNVGRVSTGWVLVQTSEDNATEVVGRLAALPGVERAEQTVGAYDVVVRVSAAEPTVDGLGEGDTATAAPVPSARQVARAALRIPGVTVAVCCHDGPAENDPAARDHSIDVTDSVFGQPAPAQPGLGSASAGGLATL
jgi:hypothetical protein